MQQLRDGNLTKTNNYSYFFLSLETLKSQIGEKDLLLDLFQKLDFGLKGYLVFDDLIKYMKDLGGKFDKDDFKRLFQRFQKHKSGRVNFEEFLLEFGSEKTI